MSADPHASPAYENPEFKALVAKLPRNLFLIFVGAGLINSFWPKAEPWITLAVIVLVVRGVLKLVRGFSGHPATLRRLAQAVENINASGRSRQPNLDEMMAQFPDLSPGQASQAELLEARRRQLAEAKRRTQLEAQAMRQRVKAMQQASGNTRPKTEISIEPAALIAREFELPTLSLKPSLTRRIIRQPITGRKRAVRKKRQGSVRPSNMDSKIF
jgi:hypothetical protein